MFFIIDTFYQTLIYHQLFQNKAKLCVLKTIGEKLKENPHRDGQKVAAAAS